MKHLLLALGLVLTGLLGTSQAWAVDWPNEPTGATVIVDCNFSSITCGQLSTQLNSGGAYQSVVTDGTAPLSPSSVLQHSNPAGAGTHDDYVYKTLNNLNEVYIGLWWKMNSDFQGSLNNGNKLFFIRTNDMNSFFGAYGAPGSSSFQLRFSSQNNNGISTCHMDGTNLPCTSTAGGWIQPTTDTPLTKNSWHQIEVHLKRSTSRTSQDGTLKWWLDGVEQYSQTNMNWGNGGFISFSILHTWDGTWAVVDPDHTWIHTIDHVRISQPNGISGGDTTPSSPPTSLAVQ